MYPTHCYFPTFLYQLRPKLNFLTYEKRFFIFGGFGSEVFVLTKIHFGPFSQNDVFILYAFTLITLKGLYEKLIGPCGIYSAVTEIIYLRPLESRLLNKICVEVMENNLIFGILSLVKYENNSSSSSVTKSLVGFSLKADFSILIFVYADFVSSCKSI